MTPKAISSTRQIRVPAQVLWEAVTEDHHLEACHPYIRRHSKNTNSQGISDVIVYLNEVTFTRESTAWMQGTGYDLLVGRADEPKNKVQWRIVSNDSTSCQLTISVIPHAIISIPRILRTLALKLIVRRQVALYLDAVTEGIKKWVESGDPIEKGTFRKHAWFCP